MKTLIVVAHPDLENSRVNKAWIEELKKHPNLYTVHDLYGTYPDWQFDVAREQALIEAHDKVVLQFPIFWFNCPPLLKKWLDDVFVYGWAYGSKSGHKMRGRKLALAVSAGVREHDYSAQGRYRYSLADILRPFEITAKYVGADYQPFFAMYGFEDEPGEDYQFNQPALRRGTTDYLAYLAEAR